VTYVTGGVNDSDLVTRGLELPEGNVDRDTTLTLGLEFVENPGVLEGRLAELGSLLLELLDGTLVDTSALCWASALLRRGRETTHCRSSDRWWSTFRSRRDR
jgi:hypothetical protein